MEREHLSFRSFSEGGQRRMTSRNICLETFVLKYLVSFLTFLTIVKKVRKDRAKTLLEIFAANGGDEIHK
ncbi:MAG: hypothetical protein COT34_00985 [Candidatus Nealsonbacteria bacterium CG08_land_8_20_14_0_20_43_11]|uniref:Uncharacterized protein n=1 Tax=Candidatus Nealsonbacteria bacterium CG08_land_8_20_14_0_20_43_11 TaxID=1974706 RepID=A0A2M6T187_9BACT|nr:MAG: hypothetical protein COT34_00985 [Candidatus Nealsonbacteria bacterium CG08_land_8_20_14_0_20_43_11]